MTQPKLEPCPFCGSDNVRLTTDENYNKPYYGIECRNCGIDTQDWKDDEFLIKLWNTRTPNQRDGR